MTDAHAHDDDLAQAIRTARARSGLSQVALAERLGVSQPTIAHWEAGLHHPKKAHVRALAQVLGAPDIITAGNGRAAATLAAALRPPSPSYLQRPIQHVPIFDWPLDADGFDPGSALAVDHFAASIVAERPFAVVCDDPAMAYAFAPGSVVVFEAADQGLREGAFHLVAHGGRVLIRRWRAAPDRLEAIGDDALAQTLYPETPPPSFGRAILAYRVLDAAIRGAPLPAP